MVLLAMWGFGPEIQMWMEIEFVKNSGSSNFMRVHPDPPIRVGKHCGRAKELHCRGEYILYWLAKIFCNKQKYISTGQRYCSGGKNIGGEEKLHLQNGTYPWPELQLI